MRIKKSRKQRGGATWIAVAPCRLSWTPRSSGLHDSALCSERAHRTHKHSAQHTCTGRVCVCTCVSAPAFCMDTPPPRLTTVTNYNRKHNFLSGSFISAVGIFLSTFMRMQVKAPLLQAPSKWGRGVGGWRRLRKSPPFQKRISNSLTFADRKE